MGLASPQATGARVESVLNATVSKFLAIEFHVATTLFQGSFMPVVLSISTVFVGSGQSLRT